MTHDDIFQMTARLAIAYLEAVGGRHVGGGATRAELMTASAEKVVKPHIFNVEYENLMIYVKEADPATGQWKGVFVADSRGVRYLQRSGRGLLPLEVRSSTVISVADVEGLPKTAAKGAVADGPWQALTSELTWKYDIGAWHLRAWLVNPVPAVGEKGHGLRQNT